MTGQIEIEREIGQRPRTLGSNRTEPRNGTRRKDKGGETQINWVESRRSKRKIKKKPSLKKNAGIGHRPNKPFRTKTGRQKTL